MIFTLMSHSTKKFNIFYFSIILSALYVRNGIYCHSLLKSNSSETSVKYSMLQYDLSELIPSHVITNQNITKVNYDSCFDHTIYNSEYMGYYEQKDIVLQQYLSLPYPAVPKELLEIEMIMKRLNKPIAIHKKSQGSLIGNKTNNKTKHHIVHIKHPFLNYLAFFNICL